MQNKMPSEDLCAQCYDALIDHGITQWQNDALVSAIYDSDRTIDICKEIAVLAKAAISADDNLSPYIRSEDIHHIPLRRIHGVVVKDEHGIPYIVGKRYEALNKLLHLPPSDVRDASLTVLTKLSSLVLPLKVGDAVLRTPEMIDNIESSHPCNPKILNDFRKYTRKTLQSSGIVKSYDWRKNTLSLQTLCCKYTGSTKKKPCRTVKDDGEIILDMEAEANNLDAYVLPLILISKGLRCLYESDKESFLTLVTSHGVTKVIDDTVIYQFETVDDDIVGRMGIRMQEAEKVRTLWMPFVIYESLVNPAVVLLEKLVKASPHQTTFKDDAVAASEMRMAYFPRKESATETVYSIDQSSFTDNFPYELQRIILEELVHMGKIPHMTLRAFDQMVKGGYAPSYAFSSKNIHNGEPIHFKKGTPMGDPGAFMLATYAHELLIGMLEEQLRVDTPYFVQGDDSTVQGDELYELYRHTMTELGATVNQTKTMESRRAIEYCGFISTESISKPMYRPHSRMTDNPRDLFSPRALSAFGEQKLVDWTYLNRPELIPQLQVAGIVSIPLDEDHEQLFQLRDVCMALTDAEDLLQEGITPEQMGRIFLIQDYFPVFEYDDTDFIDDDIQARSDWKEYQSKIAVLKCYRNNLIADPLADPYQMAAKTLRLCDDIKEHHKDFVSDIHPPKKDNDHSKATNPYKSNVGKADKSLNVAKKLLKQLQTTSKQKGDNHHDDYSL